MQISEEKTVRKDDECFLPSGSRGVDCKVVYSV